MGFAIAGLAQIGQIFQQWDAVVSWNRWAIDWAANRLPSGTGLYPQLLPANVSLTYVFMQTSEIWIFAKAFQFLFCLMLLLAMFDAARATGNFGFVPGVLITYGLLVAVLRFRMIGSGYADVPLAFFSFAAVYALLLATGTRHLGTGGLLPGGHPAPGNCSLLAGCRVRSAEGAQMRAPCTHGRRYVMVGAVLAAGAALTKQTGLYIALLYPLLAWLLALRNRPDPVGRNAGTLLRVALLTGALAAPWYLHKFAEFRAARDGDNTARLVSDFHEGRSLPQRLLHGAGMLADAITPAGAALLLLAIAAGLRDPLTRWLVGLVVAPLGLIWAAGFSYDLRNLTLVLPFAGAAAGMGLSRAVERLGGSHGSEPGRATHLRSGTSLHCPPGQPAGESQAGGPLRWLRVGPTGPGTRQEACNSVVPGAPPAIRLLFRCAGCPAGVLALAVVAACLCVSDTTLREWQARQQRLVGIPKLNQQLYAYFESHGGSAVIATDYLAAAWLPELGPRSVRCTCLASNEFRETYDRPEVRYALVRQNGAATAVLEYLDGPAGRLVFEACGYGLYEKPGRVKFDANLSPAL